MADKPETKERPALHPSRRMLAEQRRQIHSVVPEFGTTIAEMLNPGYWAHVARDLRPGDRIEVDAEDGSYFAELMVRDAGAQYAKVALLREVKLDAIEPSATVSLPGHNVEWSGPHTKWRVLRTADRKVLKDGFTTKADGYNWLASYSKAVAA
jgi:hypothetical protein